MFVAGEGMIKLSVSSLVVKDVLGVKHHFLDTSEQLEHLNVSHRLKILSKSVRGD